MIARLYVHLPFHLTVPVGEEFPIFEYEDSGYMVRDFPPMRSDQAPAIDGPEQLEIDGVPAFQADLLRIDFAKESFERGTESPRDPPEDVIIRAVTSFLQRLRHVARAPQVRPLNFPFVTWRLKYLNDDETELEKDENLVRVRGSLQFKTSFIALNKTVWEDLCSLPADYEPPIWDSLLLDANAELTRIGPSIVLAWTDLEVFISKMLNQLAEVKNVDTELWTLINQREGRRQGPTVEEQYDALLKFLTGHSLKEEKKLWESFKNLKTARNSFVHEGVARVGKSPLDTEMTRKLIYSASIIIQKVREWLPQDLQWPEYGHDIQVRVTRQLR